MKELIKKIGDLVIDNFFDFGSNEYVLDDNEARMTFLCDYNHHTIYGSVLVRGGKLIYIEVLLEDGGEYENVEKAVNEYVEAKFDANEWYSLCVEDYRDNTMDEWQRNGFRDEADYWHYRLGA